MPPTTYTYYSLDNFRNRQMSPLRTLCRSIDCQSVPSSQRFVNKHRRASAIFSYFSLSFPDTLSRRKRYCSVSKKAQPQRGGMFIETLSGPDAKPQRGDMCIKKMLSFDRLPYGMFQPHLHPECGCLLNLHLWYLINSIQIIHLR